jgi:sugar phosphate isomerase/epimerase
MGMKVGVDGRKIPGAAERGPIGILEYARELGLDGVFFRSVLEMSPTLDAGELREIRQHADALDLYLEVGVGKVNPYCTAELPEIRAIGGGDYRLGMERQIRACRAIDCNDFWVGTANYKAQYPGYFAFDRFRTDVTWGDQLVAIEKFLKVLAPLLRDLDCRLNLETHEEITTFEVVRLVESVGPDVIGITFDTVNVITRAEDPIAAARRIAPYVRTTHFKDALPYFVPDGLARQIVPCGQGVIDWSAIIAILGAYRPDLHLSIENALSRSTMVIQIYDPVWQAGHPDLTVAELAELVRLTRAYEERVAQGTAADPKVLATLPFGNAEAVEFIQSSAAYLRGVLESQGLAG